jgi:ribosomal-protein-alanine N-acetyltransferase
VNTATQAPLEGTRVRLRGMRQSDVPALFAMQSDPDGMRYWSYPPLQRIEQAQALFEKNDRDALSGDSLSRAIAIRPDDTLIGTCTLFAIDNRHRRAMIGYALARPHWGNGYAQEALRLLLGHAFGALGLLRVEADIDPRNAASIRLVERLGFAREGLLRERYRVGDDVQDSAMYGLLARDYAAALTA